MGGKSWLGLALSVATLLLLMMTGSGRVFASGVGHEATNSSVLQLGPEQIRFHPAYDSDLQRVARKVVVARRLSSEAVGGATRRERSNTRKYQRGLDEIAYLIDAAVAHPEPRERSGLMASLLETVAAVGNNAHSPLPKSIDTIQLPWAFFSRLYRPVARGRTPAVNLRPGPQEDLSRLDPEPSTFWRAPNRISSLDLYHGFGRTTAARLETQLFDYVRAKDNFGLNPGFELEGPCGRLKVKFGEVSSEPFVARIFDALGFHADPTDYAASLKVRYNRRLFQEFNSRQEMKTRFTFLGLVPVYCLELQRWFDPFDYVAWAVLRDGNRWTGRQLKQQLLRETTRSQEETDGANFRPEIESQIEYLLTVPANVQARPDHLKNIGPWDFAQLDHPDRRELRGAGLLAAWLGWFDTRFDNTRLRIVKHEGVPELVHYFSDLGGALGETEGLLFSRGELPNRFPWTFTRPPLWQGAHHLAVPLRIEGYKPIARTAPFTAMTIDDARWMARLIGQLTERQIIQALVASGYDSALVRLYTEKLLSRRDRMIVDLGLSGEIPLCRPQGAQRRLCYDPAVDGPIVIRPSGQGTVQAPVGEFRIVDGEAVQAPKDPSASIRGRQEQQVRAGRN